MDPRELENEVVADGDEAKVAEMLNSLKRVEAPANFEFGVRARIAAGAPQTRSSLIPFVKLAAPLSLVLVVGAFVLFYGSLPSSTDTPRVVENDVVEKPVQTEPTVASPATSTERQPIQRVSGPNATESASSIEPQTNSRSLDTQVARRNKLNTSNRDRRGGSIDLPMRGGSVDSGLKQSNTISINGMGKDIPVKEVLNMMGITADFVNNGWKVRGTSDGSVAHKSGFQAGDVIELIDGLAVSDKTAFKGGFSGKTFSVRRDGKPIEIKLTN
jgi:hypothetical protein